MEEQKQKHHKEKQNGRESQRERKHEEEAKKLIKDEAMKEVVQAKEVQM